MSVLLGQFNNRIINYHIAMEPRASRFEEQRPLRFLANGSIKPHVHAGVDSPICVRRQNRWTS